MNSDAGFCERRELIVKLCSREAAIIRALFSFSSCRSPLHCCLSSRHCIAIPQLTTLQHGDTHAHNWRFPTRIIGT